MTEVLLLCCSFVETNDRNPGFFEKAVSTSYDLADNLAVPVLERVEPAAVVVIAGAAEPPPSLPSIPLDELLRPDLPGSTVRSVR